MVEFDMVEAVPAVITRGSGLIGDRSGNGG